MVDLKQNIFMSSFCLFAAPPPLPILGVLLKANQNLDHAVPVDHGRSLNDGTATNDIVDRMERDEKVISVGSSKRSLPIFLKTFFSVKCTSCTCVI